MKRINLNIKYPFLIFILAISVWISVSCVSAEKQQCEENYYSAETLTDVATNQALQENIIHYTGMTVSFNPRLHVPNWVAWELTEDETEGEEPRHNKFMCDENVPGCADDWDYRYSGYDRGHMAPAGDMKWSEKAMEESFFLTNICPQSPDLNRGSWKKLEEKCRILAQKDSAIIIICGPVLTDPIKEYLGDSRVAVPQRFFKVILSPYGETPTAIGFIMPNEKVKGGMQACAVPIDSIEAVTGHDFFHLLPEDVQESIETQCNFNKWSRYATKRKQ